MTRTTGRHQRYVAGLLRLLHDTCPEPYEVLPAPSDWVLWTTRGLAEPFPARVGPPGLVRGADG